MISRASELLQNFIEVERRKLADINMPHMPTLGTAYEEITKAGLYQDFAIPKSLDLKTVSGFISVGGEMLPEQIDCMLVHGEGKRYGLTSNYIYDVEQVLCMFEVKKTLRRADYIDAMQHLANIRKKFAKYFEVKLNQGIYPDISRARLWFSQITGKAAPEHYLGMHDLPRGEGILFYTLIQESLAPVSIIHGYDGFKTEHGLRSAFASILEENWQNGDKKLGVPSIPALVTCGKFCIVKGNGLPFLIMRDDEWVPVFSTCHNSAGLILEIVWSKISAFFDVEMPWEDGLYMNNPQPLLIAKGLGNDTQAGWVYRTIEPKQKHLVREDDESWKPSEVGRPEMAALNIMAVRGGYLPLDRGLDEYLAGEHGSSLEVVLQNLRLTREFMTEDEWVRPIHKATYILTNDDGTGLVSSEKERLDLWCAETGCEPRYLIIWLMEE
ncbi:DUF6602 domain-containing protein [Pseudomonas monteilii]|uniref:DUF6602 domain-containing protein n=1 Tax=Pseudomonas monteilii TaxID=76759 RepID=UPI003CFE6BA9